MNLEEKGIIIRETAEYDLHQIFSAGTNDPAFSGLMPEWTPENLLSVFSSETAVCFTAVRAKKVIGFITGSVSGPESNLYCIMVKRTLRGAGIGGELLRSFIKSSGKKGSERFRTAALPDNHESLKFFEKYGFIQSEKLVRLYK